MRALPAVRLAPNIKLRATFAIVLGAVVFPVPASDASPGRLSPGDWSSIREAHELAGHDVLRREGGSHAARNPGQQWTTEFDGRGFLVRPDHGNWTWGMELDFKDQGQSPRARVSADGNRLSYRWSGGLEEWFINDDRGLEQGWTLPFRPVDSAAATGEPVTLDFRLRGGLSPHVSEDRLSVQFRSAGGAPALTYGGLKAWDADGRPLPVRFAGGSGDDRLSIQVDDAGAQYPVTIDPVAQQQTYLKASNRATYFGQAVAMSGDTVVVGATGEHQATTGVNGDEDNNGLIDSGAAYVFVRNGSSWIQQAYLKASNTGSSDRFGTSVAISGDTIVVGSAGEDSAATGVNGNQADNSASSAGAAYVFVRNGTTWTQQAYLKASNTQADDRFAISVAISGDTIVAGAIGESSAARGINGNQADNNAAASGAAYVFQRNGTTWTQQAYLKSSNSDPDDKFGIAVAISGNTLVVGADEEDSSATGVNGSQNNEASFGSGAAYVFVRNATSWTQQAYLKASNTGDEAEFGSAVAISGETLVIGSPREASATVGVNGIPAGFAANSGAAYVFARNGAAWSQQAYLKASNTGAQDFFGRKVAVSEDTVAVGAPEESSAATGVNGNKNDNNASRSGAAYVFLRSGTSWTEHFYLKASNSEAFDLFGDALGLSGDTLVAGAWGEDSAANGVDGDMANNSRNLAGAAYLFDLDVAVPTTITAAELQGTNYTVDFTGAAGVADWRVMGSENLASFPDDLTADSTIVEVSPGRYHIVVDLTGAPERYFLRIER